MKLRFIPGVLLSFAACWGWLLLILAFPCDLQGQNWVSLEQETALAAAWKPVLDLGDLSAWQVQPLRKGVILCTTNFLAERLGAEAVVSEWRNFVLRRKLAGEGFEMRYRVKIDVGKPASQVWMFRPVEAKTVSPPLLRVVLRANENQLTINAGNLTRVIKARPYDTVLPMWPERMRLPLEHDMSQLPNMGERWFDVRMIAANGQFEMWANDRFLLRLNFDSAATEFLDMYLQGSVALAKCRLIACDPATATGEFHTVALDGYVNDRYFTMGKRQTTIAEDALPFGTILNVNGIPVRLVERLTVDAPDHLDLGRSLVREGMAEGYVPVTGPRLGSALTPDPARIVIRLPYDVYDRLYVLAAFNGAPDHIPLFSAAFSRPDAGFHQIFEGIAPGFDALSEEVTDCRPVKVKLVNGRTAHLWLVEVKLDPARLASFADSEAIELELTKKMELYRSYPDPISYGWHGAGLPSGVQVYGLTLRRSALDIFVEPAKFGHVWTAPETPAYNITVTNRSCLARSVALELRTTSHDGVETVMRDASLVLAPFAGACKSFTLPVTRNGIHTLVVKAVSEGLETREEVRNLARLAEDTRARFWQDGEGPLFGYWSYHGGHHTPAATNIMAVMHAAGGRATMGRPSTPDGVAQTIFSNQQWRAPSSPFAIWVNNNWESEEAVATYSNRIAASLKKHYPADAEFFTPYAEPVISRNLTVGAPPEYWNGAPYELNESEKTTLSNFMRSSEMVGRMIRNGWPDAKILIPWGDPLFVVPMLRAGFPRELIDGSGLDMIGFERMPEQQIHQMSTHRLYILREEFRKYGMPDPSLYYVEGIFSPTEPGALTWSDQADYYHRWSLLSLAYGVQRFYSGWFAFDCGNYYGAEHYGGCGIQRRIPYEDPKPAYAHYATMTRQLDRSRFAGWLPTGSHSVYCLKFARPSGTVYVLWTLRGKRPVELDVGGAASVTLTDAMDNGVEIAARDGKVVIMAGTSPVYVAAPDALRVSALGAPDHGDSKIEAQQRDLLTWHNGLPPPARSVTHEKVIADLGDGKWRQQNMAIDADYQDNNYDTARFPGNMSTSIVGDDERPGQYLAVHLEEQDTERQLMPWYTILKPPRPIVISGRAAALGIWAKAHSDWGRVVYVLRDARGERWQSVGTRDQWNCDDLHSWSAFNYDGWRYLRFELPSNAPYDRYRSAGSVWWGSRDGDGIVDLPLKLESVIVERRTHLIYVNDIQPANPADVLLGELVAEYATADDASDAAIKRDRIAMPLPCSRGRLANPIGDMEKQGTLPPVKLIRVSMPDWGADGTRAHIHFTEMPAATEYQVWVAAYADGRGAVQIGSMKKSGGLVDRLRPAMKLYLWVTYTAPGEGDGKPRITLCSRPSNALKIELVDAFGQK